MLTEKEESAELSVFVLMVLSDRIFVYCSRLFLCVSFCFVPTPPTPPPPRKNKKIKKRKENIRSKQRTNLFLSYCFHIIKGIQCKQESKMAWTVFISE